MVISKPGFCFSKVEAAVEEDQEISLVKEKVVKKSRQRKIPVDVEEISLPVIIPTEDTEELLEFDPIPAILNEFFQDAHRVKAEKCRRSFYYFCREFINEAVPDEISWNWHIKEVCDIIQKSVMK